MTVGAKTKIFIGFLQNSELKMHLKQSVNWKRAKDLSEQGLIEAQHKAQEYIGLWVEPPIIYDRVKKIEIEIRSQLQLYCPKIKLESHLIYLFPQVFVF